MKYEAGWPVACKQWFGHKPSTVGASGIFLYISRPLMLVLRQYLRTDPRKHQNRAAETNIPTELCYWAGTLVAWNAVVWLYNSRTSHSSPKKNPRSSRHLSLHLSHLTCRDFPVLKWLPASFIISYLRVSWKLQVLPRMAVVGLHTALLIRSHHNSHR
jgi:hypothetical protein